MPEGFRADPKTLMSKLDELLNEYAEKRKLMENEGDIYSMEKNGSEIDITGQFKCEFKDTCYALKFNSGTCPCELVK
jgi:hypothetical protein